MAFQIKSITVKNFMSVGNVSQAISFDKESLTLVLGVNLDLGGECDGNRNGTGKTTISNALSYAFYGQALTSIKKENLINKINGKNMLVTVEFEKNGTNYRIERGRKPNILKLYVNNQEIKATQDEDESQGDSRETQKSIESLLEMSHTMFKHFVALNTYTEPFLSLKSSDQRELIEQLLGITLLSEKAETLKAQIKDTKDLIQQEQFKIESIKLANANVQKSISSLELKSAAWETKKQNDIASLTRAINELANVSIDAELQLHTILKEWEVQDAKLVNLTKQKATLETAAAHASKAVNRYALELEKLLDKKCPACEQHLHDTKHAEMAAIVGKNLIDSETYANKVNNDLNIVISEISTIDQSARKPATFYDTESEALGHKNNLDNLEIALKNKLDDSNPFNEQIEELCKTALQGINWDTVNTLSRLKDHQEFLHKLLTNKDSFVRKKIIDQNLNYLNSRLSYYINKLGLPHVVVFHNDLSVEITQLGKDLDFDNLSRGERNRLILSLSFAFRDVWEGLYQSINLMFVDELMDSGMDAAGVEAGLSVLKQMARDRNKNIFLISHKDELIGRVNNVLNVVKSNGFTEYSADLDYVE